MAGWISLQPFLTLLVRFCCQGWKSLPILSPASSAAPGDHITLLEVTRLRSQNTTEGKAEKLRKVLSLTSLLKQDQHQTTTCIRPRFLSYEKMCYSGHYSFAFFLLTAKSMPVVISDPQLLSPDLLSSLLTCYFHLAPAAAPRLLQFPLFFSYSHLPLTAHDITVGSDAQLPFSFLFFNIYLFLAASGFCCRMQDLCHGLRVH